MIPGECTSESIARCAAQRTRGYNDIHEAAESGNLPAVRYLLDEEGDRLQALDYGPVPRGCFGSRSHRARASLLRHPSIARCGKERPQGHCAGTVGEKSLCGGRRQHGRPGSQCGSAQERWTCFAYDCNIDATISDL